MKKSIIVKSFTKCGIYDSSLGTFNLWTILGNCTKPPTIGAYAHIEASLSELARLFTAKGELIEVDYTHLGFRTAPDDNKDGW